MANADFFGVVGNHTSGDQVVGRTRKLIEPAAAEEPADVTPKPEVPAFNPATSTTQGGGNKSEADLTDLHLMAHVDALDAEKEPEEKPRYSKDVVQEALQERQSRQAEETNALLEKKSKGQAVAAQKATWLETTASPGLRKGKQPVQSAGAKAKNVYADLEKIHAVLKDHYNTIGAQINARADQYKDAADAIAAQNPRHPLVAQHREVEGFLRNQAETRSLREALGVENNLTDARASLDRVRQQDANGNLKSQLRTPEDLPTPDLHLAIKAAAASLAKAHNTLNQGQLSLYGIGSPIAPQQMKDVLKRAVALQAPKNSKMTASAPQEMKKPSEVERDIHPVTGRKAKPGHIWWNTAAPGAQTQVEATPENLKAYEKKYGKQHADLPRLRAMVNERTRATRKVTGHSTEDTRPVVTETVPLVDATGEKPIDVGVTTRATRRVRSKDALTPAAKKAVRANRQKTVIAAATRESDERPMVRDRSVPAVQESLISKATSHLQDGKRLPKDLRTALGAEGVAEAMRRSGLTREI